MPKCTFTDEEKQKMRDLAYWTRQAFERNPNATLWVPVTYDLKEAELIVRALDCCAEEGEP